MSAEQSYDCDVLVIGTGASGMSAAVTAAAQGLKVLVVEKEPKFGGTTARSGGWLWIPGTSLAKAGHPRGPGSRAHLPAARGGNSFDAARVDAFLENGPKAVDFFTTKTAVQFDMPPVFPDYHAEAPGGTAGRPLDGGASVRRPRARRAHQESGAAAARADRLRHDAGLGQGDRALHAGAQVAASRSPTSPSACRSTSSQVLRHGRGMTLTNGNALAGRLAKAAMDLDIPVWLSSPAKELIVEYGGVRGAIVERDGKRIRVTRAPGVVLACGGFPHDVERRKAALSACARPARSTSRPRPTRQHRRRLAPGRGGRRQGRHHRCRTLRPGCRHRSRRARTARKGVMPHFIDRAKPGVIAVTRERQALHQRRQLVPRLRPGHGRGVRRASPKSRPGSSATTRPCANTAWAASRRSRCPIGRHLRTGYL